MLRFHSWPFLAGATGAANRYSVQFLNAAKLLHWNGHYKPWGRLSSFSEVWDKWYIPDPLDKFHPIRRHSEDKWTEKADNVVAGCVRLLVSTTSQEWGIWFETFQLVTPCVAHCPSAENFISNFPAANYVPLSLLGVVETYSSSTRPFTLMCIEIYRCYQLRGDHQITTLMTELILQITVYWKWCSHPQPDLVQSETFPVLLAFYGIALFLVDKGCCSNAVFVCYNNSAHMRLNHSCKVCKLLLRFMCSWCIFFMNKACLLKNPEGISNTDVKIQSGSNKAKIFLSISSSILWLTFPREAWSAVVFNLCSKPTWSNSLSTPGGIPNTKVCH